LKNSGLNPALPCASSGANERNPSTCKGSLLQIAHLQSFELNSAPQDPQILTIYTKNLKKLFFIGSQFSKKPRTPAEKTVIPQKDLSTFPVGSNEESSTDPQKLPRRGNSTHTFSCIACNFGK
jgi:hypothetical protein